MFGISGTELLIILFFGFLIFGPDKLPQIGRTVGRAIRQFRDASEAANKKFKEQVADPFQDAIAPYKDQVEESAKPIKDDIDAINQTLNETKSMFTDPFKDVFASEDKSSAKAKGTVIATGTAVDADAAAPAKKADGKATPADSAALGEDPFGDAPADAVATTEEAAPAKEGKPIPDAGGTVKKSLASSLYGLDGEGGE